LTDAMHEDLHFERVIRNWVNQFTFVKYHCANA
jgi:hypothetical protein